MITITKTVEDVLLHDDIALAAAKRGILNLSAYARTIKPQIQAAAMKTVQDGSIITALSRLVAGLPAQLRPSGPDATQSLSVHSNLEGMTYERSRQVSARIAGVYSRINAANNAYLTVTQGINEITVVAEARVAEEFRTELAGAHMIYHKRNLVGITIKFDLGNLDVPNVIYARTQRLAFKDINIIEVVSTATELTYMVEKKDLAVALEQLQKDI